MRGPAMPTTGAVADRQVGESGADDVGTTYAATTTGPVTRRHGRRPRKHVWPASRRASSSHTSKPDIAHVLTAARVTGIAGELLGAQDAAHRVRPGLDGAVTVRPPRASSSVALPVPAPHLEHARARNVARRTTSTARASVAPDGRSRTARRCGRTRCGGARSIARRTGVDPRRELGALAPRDLGLVVERHVPWSTARYLIRVAIAWIWSGVSNMTPTRRRRGTSSSEGCALWQRQAAVADDLLHARERRPRDRCRTSARLTCAMTIRPTIATRSAADAGASHAAVASCLPPPR